MYKLALWICLVAACGSTSTPPPTSVDLGGGTPDPLQVCYSLGAGGQDACAGKHACNGDNKDCGRDLCGLEIGGDAGGDRYGRCINSRCFWKEPPRGTDYCFRRKPTACEGAVSCTVSRDCAPALCGASFYGLCLQNRCYYYDPTAP